MKIVDVVCAPGRTGFFFDDQKAIKASVSDGAAYIGTPVTPGFKSIRQAGRVHLALCWCWRTARSRGATARRFSIPVRAAVTRCSWLRTSSRSSTSTSNPHLVGKEADQLQGAGRRDRTPSKDPKTGKTHPHRHPLRRHPGNPGRRSQSVQAHLMAKSLPTSTAPPSPTNRLPIFTQSGDNRYENADKMILKGAARSCRTR